MTRFLMLSRVAFVSAPKCRWPALGCCSCLGPTGYQANSHGHRGSYHSYTASNNRFEIKLARHRDERRM
ncbi:hypothetical protein BJX63DRAFT_55360 [Aspergillus granulosus]|uniref:Secreted protein n=1 Tax=Aspergillus granulosus TaxID=176169 RepID=A0ABR4GXT7_9EURO